MSMLRTRAGHLAMTGLLPGSLTLGTLPASAATRSQEPSVRARGTVAITDWQFPDGCNQLATSSVANIEICAPMQDSLFKIDNRLHYIPNLALTIPTTQNGGARVV